MIICSLYILTYLLTCKLLLLTRRKSHTGFHWYKNC